MDAYCARAQDDDAVRRKRHGGSRRKPSSGSRQQRTCPPLPTGAAFGKLSYTSLLEAPVPGNRQPDRITCFGCSARLAITPTSGLRLRSIGARRSTVEIPGTRYPAPSRRWLRAKLDHVGDELQEIAPRRTGAVMLAMRSGHRPAGCRSSSYPRGILAMNNAGIPVP